MSKGQRATGLGILRALFTAGTTVGLTDSELLRAYREEHVEPDSAEAAFAAIVDRHGPMVWGVCRRALHDLHEAEDAFQATFLILARRANALKVDDSLGGWLYGVARRVAARARSDGLRREARARQSAMTESTSVGDEIEHAECLTVFDEEIGRLPERYRAPLVLCYLEGLTYAQAGEQLGCPRETVKRRLAKARVLLRARLTRRGLAPAGISLASPVLPDSRGQFPPRLAELAARLASKLSLAGESIRLPNSMAAIVNRVIRSMIIIRWAKTLALFSLLAVSVCYFVGEFRTASVETIALASDEPAPGRTMTPKTVSSTITVKLPDSETLHRLLRQAAKESMKLARKQPSPSSWTLSTIAKAQAKAGDREGARLTFSTAESEAAGEFGGKGGIWYSARVAHMEVEAGLLDDARQALQRSLMAIPGIRGDIDKDRQTLMAMALIVKDQARIGGVEQARLSLDKMKALAVEFLEKSKIGNAEMIIAEDIAAAQGALGDFPSAIGRKHLVSRAEVALGEAALAAAKCLDREKAKTFVNAMCAQIEQIKFADGKYSALSKLAEAQAWVGDLAGAKKSARSIGSGPNRSNYDMTDGQPYAMILIANAQSEAGDFSGLRETLREAHQMIAENPKMRERDGRLAQVAMSQIRGFDVEGARITVDSMKKGERHMSLGRIACAQSLLGRENDARETMKLALEDAQIRANIPPQQPSDYQHLSSVKAMAGDVTGAVATLRRIEAEIFEKSAFREAVSVRAIAGDVAGALKLALENSGSEKERQFALEGFGLGVEVRLMFDARLKVLK